MYSVISIFDEQVKKHPEKLLFAFLDIRGNTRESFSYSAFQQRTKCVAFHIRNYGLKPGDRVLLAYSPGLEMIASFFACVRLGLIPVPVYSPSAHGLEASAQKMNFIAHDCGASAVLTDRSCYWAYKINGVQQKNGISNLAWIVTDEADETKEIEHDHAAAGILFIQYTSGSTSEPKGVMVTHENIICNGNNVVDHLPVGVSWLPQYHDMGLIGYYLFFALKGGTTYGFSPADFIQRPALWLETITRFRATASSAPNFAYDYCLQPGKIPEEILDTLDLGSLRFLMTAAEPIQADIFRRFYKKFSAYGLRREAFFGAYGLAEFTLAVTNYGTQTIKVNADSLTKREVKIIDEPADDHTTTKELMSCGKPLHDTELCIVNENTGTRAAEFSVGEIWLKGKSACLGYWDRPLLSEQLFKARLNGDDPGNWLRTGDLGFLHNNELYVCGRLKDLIIIRGVNYYPQDIEALAEASPLVRKGCAMAFISEHDDSIVVVAGVKNPTKLPREGEIEERIYSHFGIRIHEVVFVAARTIPKTSSGKLRRFECRERYLQNNLPVISRIKHQEHTSLQKSGNNDKTIQLTGNTTDLDLLFNRYLLSGRETAALGYAGLDSLKIAEFGHDLDGYLEKKGFSDLSGVVDLKLLQRTSVATLFTLLREVESASLYTRFRFRQGFEKIRTEFERSESDLMQKDASLKFNFSAAKEEIDPGKVRGSIFMTGATGFFGAFLLKSILEQHCTDIYVLVRSGSAAEGYSRVREAFSNINPGAELVILFQQRVKIICGDLALPQLGLSDPEWNSLCSQTDTIYHNGAYVNYLMDYETMRASNVTGTRDVIKLAMCGRRKTLNYISTTFIFGWSAKDTLFETDANSAMEYLDFGYSQSKWVADQLVLKAMGEGLAARIFRPALISPSIAGEGYNFDISIRLLAFMVKHGISTSAQNQVSFTPADIAANNIVAISTIDASVGKTFHVTRDDYSSMRDVTESLAVLAGTSFSYFKLNDFVPEVISRCTRNDLLFPLLNFLVRSADNINGMEFKRYDNNNYRTFRQLSPWGKKDPPLNEVVNGIYLFMSKHSLIGGNNTKTPATSPAGADELIITT